MYSRNGIGPFNTRGKAIEPVRPDVPVGADDPDVGEALALLAQLGHAGDVRVVAREELHLGTRDLGGRNLDLGGVPLDVHQHGGHGRRETGDYTVQMSDNLARKMFMVLIF